jgi:subtilase family serine protease
MGQGFWPAVLTTGATVLFLAGSAPVAAGVNLAGLSAASSALPAAVPFATVAAHDVSAQPPTTAQCETEYGLACYSPQQLQTAYDMGSLYASGHNGAGETIVLVDSYGSPTITADLKTFDNGFGLPAPPSFKIITPEGPPPAFNPSNSQMVAWADETSLDVEYAHAMAPGANLLLVETPSDETVGTAGFPDIVKAEKYVIENHLGEVISQSFGAPEQTFPSAASIDKLRGAYKLASKDGVTVLAATGDQGASGIANAAGTEYFTSRVVDWPASDPLVTAVGGT